MIQPEFDLADTDVIARSKKRLLELGIELPDVVEKHLPNQHDQSTHGSGKGGVHTPEEAESRIWSPKGQGLEASEAKAKVAEMTVAGMRKAGVTDEQFKSYFEETAVAVAKRNSVATGVKEGLTKEFEGTKRPEDIVLILQENTGLNPLTDAFSLRTQLKRAGIPFPTAGQVSYQEAQDLIKQINKKDNSLSLMFADTPEAADLMAKSAVNSLVQTWAATSNDTDATACILQERAKALFGIADSADWDYSFVKDEMNELSQKHSSIYDSFLQTQYDNTQQYFKDNKITELTVYRGVYANQITSVKAGSPAFNDVQLRPMSSFSTDFLIAYSFAEPEIHSTPLSLIDTGRGYVMKTVVPVSKVIATPLTGVGCLRESEIVVLGGKQNVQIALQADTKLLTDNN